MSNDNLKRAKEQIAKTKGLSTKSTAVNKTLSGQNQKQVSDLLERYRLSIEAAIPKHLSADRMIAIASTVVAKNPAIAECSTGSIIGAIVQASMLGFPPIEQLGYCYFVPFNNKKTDPGTGKDYWVKEVQFIIGYRGFIELARRSGEVLNMYSFPVFENDDFDYQLGTDPWIRHKPFLGEDRGRMSHVYAVAMYKSGGMNFVVLTRAEVDKLRLRNRSQKNGVNGAWKTDYEKMAAAKACRQLSTFLPLNPEIQEAISTDEMIIGEGSLSTNKTGIEISKLESPDFDSYDDMEDDLDFSDVKTDKDLFIKKDETKD